MTFAEINSHELLWYELAAEPVSDFYLSAGTETYAVHPQPAKVLHGFTLQVPETGKFVQTPESIQFFRTFHIKPLVYGGLLDSAAVSVRADRKLYPHTLDTQVQAMALRFLHHRTVHGDLQTWELILNDADIRATLYLRANTQSANLAFVNTKLFKGMYLRADPNAWVVDMPEPRLLRMAILYPTVEPFTLISPDTPIRKDLRLFANEQGYEWVNQDGRFLHHRAIHGDLQTWKLLSNAADIRATRYLPVSTQGADLVFVNTKLFKGMYLRADPNAWAVDMPESRLLRTAILYPTNDPFVLAGLDTSIRKDLRLFVNDQGYKWTNQDSHLITQRYLGAELQTTLFEGGESSYTWLHVLKPLARLLQATEQDINLLKASKLWADLGMAESMGGPSKLFFNDFLWSEIVVIRPSELREVIRPFKE